MKLSRGSLVFLALFMVAGAGAAAPGQDEAPRLVDALVTRDDAVVVKFRDEQVVRLRDGALMLAVDEPVNFVLPALEGRAVERYFTRGEADLDAERTRLLERLPAGERAPADLNDYYRVHVAGADDARALLAELRASPLVQVAYREPAPESIALLDCSDLAPTTPSFAPLETFLDPAPLGVGYEELVDLVGMTAPDQRIYQIEFEWDLEHEDACKIDAAAAIGVPPTGGGSSSSAHADAVAGILIAERNAYGVDGMACDAGFRYCAMLENWPAANAISLMTADARPGDVFITSVGWYLTTNAVAPFDYYQAEFDAIHTAALSGITYCFGAGNAPIPDQPADLGDTAIFGTRYVPGAPESGGVIVGGGLSDQLTAWSGSNYGARVDCHAWAEDIVTIGYDASLFGVAGTKQQDYTRTFGGTSGAGPIVAGVAAALIGTVWEQDGVLLTPQEVLADLRTYGTPTSSGVPIGPRPDMAQLLAAHGLPDGLRVRHETSTGKVFLDVSGEAGHPGVVLGSPERAHQELGLNRPLLVARKQASVLSFVLDANGEASLEVPAIFLAQPGQRTWFQAVEYLGHGLAGSTAQRNVHLTNSVEVFVR